MNPRAFVDALSAMTFKNVFNPYHNRCIIHDLADAPYRRRSALLAMLHAAMETEIDAIWIGRDLGYRGGRRTGLALTDDLHIETHARRWGASIERATKGAPIAERTAAVIWSMLKLIEAPLFLWNVFPLHPHEPGNPLSNRSHNADERQAGEVILEELISMLQPRRLIAIGNDAAKVAERVAPNLKVINVRHPSYGGQTMFLSQIRNLYHITDINPQGCLFKAAEISASKSRRTICN